MSLGLGDLKKRRVKVSKSKDGAFGSTPIEKPANWAARSYTARPWSDSPLSPSGRRKAVVTDGVMSDEWLMALTPMFDLFSSHPLVQIQTELLRFEDDLLEALAEPLESLRSLCRIGSGST